MAFSLLPESEFTLLSVPDEPRDLPEPLAIVGPRDGFAQEVFAKHFVPPMVDVHLPDQLFLWVKFRVDCNDLEPESCAVESMGRLEPIFENEMDNGGVEGLLYYLTSHTERRWMNWALQNGIAPGQPFLIWVGEPHHYSTWTDCGTEYDTDIDVELVRVLPNTPRRAARSWERALKLITAFEKARDAERKRVHDLELRSLDAMFIRCDLYWPSRYGYDDMTPPSGVSFTIHSDHRKIPSLKGGHSWGGQIASARDDDGNHETVLKRLVVAAQAVVPALSEERIRKMPRIWR